MLCFHAGTGVSSSHFDCDGSGIDGSGIAYSADGIRKMILLKVIGEGAKMSLWILAADGFGQQVIERKVEHTVSVHIYHPNNGQKFSEKYSLRPLSQISIGESWLHIHCTQQKFGDVHSCPVELFFYASSLIRPNHSLPETKQNVTSLLERFHH